MSRKRMAPKFPNTTWKKTRRYDTQGFTILCPTCHHAVADHRREGRRLVCGNAKCMCGHAEGIHVTAE